MSCVTRLRLLSRVQHRQMLRIGLPFEPVGEYPTELCHFIFSKSQ